MDKINTPAAPAATWHSATTPPASPRTRSAQASVQIGGKTVKHSAPEPQKEWKKGRPQNAETAGSRQVKPYLAQSRQAKAIQPNALSKPSAPVTSLLDPRLKLDRQQVHEQLCAAIYNKKYPLAAQTLNDLAALPDKEAQQKALKSIFEHSRSQNYEIDKDEFYENFAKLTLKCTLNEAFNQDLKACEPQDVREVKTRVLSAMKGPLPKVTQNTTPAAQAPANAQQLATAAASVTATPPKPSQPAWVQGIKDAVHTNDLEAFVTHSNSMIKDFQQNKALAPHVEALVLELIKSDNIQTSRLWPQASLENLPALSFVAIRHGEYTTAAKLFEANGDASIQRDMLRNMLALEFDELGQIGRDGVCKDLARFMLDEYTGNYDWGQALQACDALDRVELAKALEAHLKTAKARTGLESPPSPSATGNKGSKNNLVVRVLQQLLDAIRGLVKRKSNPVQQETTLRASPKATLQDLVDAKLIEIMQDNSLQTEGLRSPLGPTERIILLAEVVQGLEGKDSPLKQASANEKDATTQAVYSLLGSSIKAHAQQIQAPA